MIDANGDGQVDCDDLREAMGALAAGTKGAERPTDRVCDEIFEEIDSDGSGSLDSTEVAKLFLKNNIKLSKEMIMNLFGGNEFTLQKFKSIITSEDYLNRFKDTLR